MTIHNDYDEFEREMQAAGWSLQEIEEAWLHDWSTRNTLNADQAGCESGPDEWEE